MRYQKRVSRVDVIGRIWMPAVVCAMSYTLEDRDLDHIREDGRGRYTRPAVDRWLTTHSGDFQNIIDFRVTISDAAGRDFDSDFKSAESEITFNDCMFPAED